MSNPQDPAEAAVSPAEPTWTDGARTVMENVPQVIRKVAMKGVESYAKRKGLAVIDEKVVSEAAAARERGELATEETDEQKSFNEEITNIKEMGARKNGERQVLDRRLFMQLQAFGGVRNTAPLIKILKDSKIDSVLYEDINDPHGIALLTMNDNPEFFVTAVRDILNRDEFASLTWKPEFTMLGRTYSLGHEADLEDWLLRKPKRVACNPDWKWAVWYPLRRFGSFAILPQKEQIQILMEHGKIGRAFGSADLGHDIRLASYGLDKHDNDIVIGLIGKELYPLSALVQVMRKTTQTSTYIKELGPFFIGKAVWQSPV
jgi:Chlorite dismutase